MISQLSLPIQWNHNRPSLLIPVCALSKQGHRLLSSLDAASGDTTAATRLISKFIASSSKSVALNALSHLLSSDLHRHSSLALPMYERIAETPWFNWNSKLASNLIASLDNQGLSDEAETLISESVQRLECRGRGRDLVLFYCDLIDSFSKHGSKRGVFDSFSRVKELLGSSMSRKVFESMINGLCALDLPGEAEKMLQEMMINEGFKPSGFEFRSIVLGYGRLGLFPEMTRVIQQMESCGYAMDTICCNVVLSSYGSFAHLSEMVKWIEKMKNSNIAFSIRTYNSVLNSCPTIMELVQHPKSVPLCMDQLKRKLEGGDEALLVEELIGTAILAENLEWNSKEGKLDLHGMHLGTAYVMILQWIEELRLRLCNGSSVVVPEEIKLVCGLGKHSSVRGESPVKALVSQMMLRLESPMRIERKKTGSFVAKGTNVKNWLG